MLNPETAHTLAIQALKYGLVPGVAAPDRPVTVAGLQFKNRLGMAAGFDKNGEAVQGLAKLGFGHVEVGTVTPKPQPGNPKPRVFRLSQDRAVINRLGFNNKGHAYMQGQLKALPSAVRDQLVLGVNIGKNKDQDDPVADYVAGVQAFAGLADYLTINISSPNTPNLRDLQQAETLKPLLEAVMNARARAQAMLPIFVKFAPDMATENLIASAELAAVYDISGLILTNTTISRPDHLASPHKNETGGLSGAPLTPLALQAVQQVRQAVPSLPLIGVGGIHSVETYQQRLNAGADLCQLYTGLIYGGRKLLRGLLNAHHAA